MLYDSDDVEECMKGDESRIKSIRKISQRFIIDVLICLFLCLERQRNLQDCISFMTIVRQKQPKLALVSLDISVDDAYLLTEDLDTIVKR